MVHFDYYLDEVILSQSNSFEPSLRIKVNMKYTKFNQDEADWVEFTDLKNRLFIGNAKKDWFEIGIAELENTNSVHLGESTEAYLSLRISPYLLQRIEELRSGDDLWFKIQPLRGTCITYRNAGEKSIDTINMQKRKEDYKYPMSEWIAHLNTTEFNKIELIEIPKITLPKIQLTEHIMKFLSEANRSMNEGRYGDVLQECRKALDALDNGIEEWATKSLTEDETNKIKQNTGKDIKKEVYLSKLIGDENKAKRLNRINVALHHYLSLDPHQSEYKGLEFTIDDAKFVLHAVTGFINNMLKYIVNKQTINEST